MGTLEQATGEVLYTPNANATGPDSFTFTVSDGQLTSAPATVTVNLDVVNAAPVAEAQTVVTDEDSAVSITLSASDDDGDALSYSVVTGSGPTNGALSGTAPNLTYTPKKDFNGSDSFTFKVNDGNDDSSPATVSITVTAVNDAPVVTISLSANERRLKTLSSAPPKRSVGDFNGRRRRRRDSSSFTWTSSLDVDLGDGKDDDLSNAELHA